MTVKSQIDKVTGLGNDSAFVYSFSPMVIYASSDLTVTHVDASGVETLLTEGTGASNYSVTVATYPGTGSITYPADEGTPMPTGESVVMKPVFTIEQQTSLSTQGGYNPKTLETQLDKGIRIDLQQQEELDRAMQLPVSATGISLELPTPVALEFFRWNAAGDAIENTDPGSAALQIPADDSVSTVKIQDGAVTIAKLGIGVEARLAALEADAATLPGGGVTVMSFFQASAPTGWTQDATDQAMMRVVSTAGGGTGGTDDPILNDKVSSHTHGLTMNAVADHAHGAYSTSNVSGQNRYFIDLSSLQLDTSTEITYISMLSAGGHTPTGTIDANAGASDWAPKYVDMILASKD